MDLQYVITTIVTGALGTLGFSILFYVHPRRLTLAILGGTLCTAVYLLGKFLLGGELLPNLMGALVGAGFSELCARLTKVPVPVYMVPCIMPLVPGGALYAAMFNFVSGNYDASGASALIAAEVALGIAGGVVIASVIGLLIRPRRKQPKNR